MTEEEILQLAENYKFCLRDEDDIRDWKVTPSIILEFARAMYDKGYNQSYDDSKNESFKGFHTCLDD